VGRPANYPLIFSRGKANEAECRRALAAGHNVTVVFRKPPYPATFWGYPAVVGDRNDLRFLDLAPCVVALKAKGAGARRDANGFVLGGGPGLPEAKAAAVARRPWAVSPPLDHRRALRYLLEQSLARACAQAGLLTPDG
jgi:hypothetical protein